MPLKLSRDESRAAAFIGLLLALSAASRVLNRPAPLSVGPGIDLTTLETESRRKLEASRQPGLRPGERIDPNTAALEQLMRLPGAGRVLAGRILEARQQAPFRSLADLDRVRGVGPATLDRWAPLLTLPADPGSARADRGRSSGSGPIEPSAAAGGSRVRPAGGPEPLDLNRATAVELEALPGIGPALAARIVAYRDSAGGFRRIEELDRVRGIGPALLSRIALRVRIGS